MTQLATQLDTLRSGKAWGPMNWGPGKVGVGIPHFVAAPKRIVLCMGM